MSKRFSQWTALITLCSLPFLIWAAAIVETNTDDVRIWLPDNTLERESYERFADLFGSDSEVIISWPGCSSNDVRMQGFMERLKQANRTTMSFDRIVSGESIIAEIGDRKFSYDQETLRKRMAGVFFSQTDDSAAVVARLSESGRQNGCKCINEIYQQADATPGLAASDLKLGGDVFTTSQIDCATNRSLLLALPAILLATLISWLCLRNVQLVVITLFVAGYSALLSVALVSALGLKINGMLVIMPILILVLSLSTAVHFCSYYVNAVRRASENPVGQMLSDGRRPCLMAIITTTIGVAMLCTSHVVAVRTFAICSALGLLFTLLSVLVVFPSLLKIWPPKLDPADSPARTGSLANWSLLGKHLSTPIATLSFVVIPLLLVGLLSVKTTLDPQNMFSSDHVVNKHREWLSNRFSQIDAIDLVATFDTDAQSSNLLAQIRQLKMIQRELIKVPQVESTFSIANICRIPRQSPRSAKSVLQESVFNDAIHAQRETLQQNRLLAYSPTSVSWRIRVGLNGKGSEHQEIAQQLEAVCHQVTRDQSKPPETWATGIWLMTSAGRCQILYDLATSFALAFLIITPLVMVLLRGVLVGLLAMIPNVLPRHCLLWNDRLARDRSRYWDVVDGECRARHCRR